LTLKTTGTVAASLVEHAEETERAVAPQLAGALPALALNTVNADASTLGRTVFPSE
jgi:hypothetical protein